MLVGVLEQPHMQDHVILGLGPWAHPVGRLLMRKGAWHRRREVLHRPTAHAQLSSILQLSWLSHTA